MKEIVTLIAVTTAAVVLLFWGKVWFSPNPDVPENEGGVWTGALTHEPRK